MQEYTANFNIRIDSARAKDTDNLTNVVKQVSWTMQGEKDGQSFELPQVTTLPDPSEVNFIAIELVDEDTLKTWIESSTENLDAIKSHIEYVLNKEIEKASYQEVGFTWKPLVDKISYPESNLAPSVNI
jgi:hypothetical protein